MLKLVYVLHFCFGGGGGGGGGSSLCWFNVLLTFLVLSLAVGEEELWRQAQEAQASQLAAATARQRNGGHQPGELRKRLH